MLNFKQFESKLSKKFSFNEALFYIAKEISNGLGYKLIRYLSHGDFGYAFKISDNKVLKLTSDKKEIEFVKNHINKKTYSTVNFYNIIKIDKKYVNKDIYAIIMDYIEPISDKEKDIFGKLYVEFMYTSEIIEGDYKSYNDYVKPEIEKIFDKDDVKFIEELLDLFNRAKKDGIDTYDQHADNIGRKDKLYFFDVN